MDSSFGQADRTNAVQKRTAVSEGTRQRLMRAAVDLIAEVGWGRVTTRAVAERAGLPHGAVSYHFRGKQDMLVEAALHTFEQAIPIAEIEAMTSVDEFIGLIALEVANRDAIDRRLAGLMMESMREAERDAHLRSRLGDLLGVYRRVMVDVVRADQERGAAFSGASAQGIATVLGAFGDGLLLQAMLDPQLDVGNAIDALRAMLRTGESPA